MSEINTPASAGCATGTGRKAALITNPAAGRYSSRKISGAVDVLKRCGIEAVVYKSRRIGDCTVQAARAVKDGVDFVIAVGGDGTINEVINGLAYTGMPLAALPLGSANVLAKEIQLPERMEKALKAIVSGKQIKIHLGKAGNQYFLLMCGVGFDAEVVRQVDLKLKKTIGKLAYVVTGLQLLASPPDCRLEIDADGKVYSGATVIISNAKHYGGPFIVAPQADLTEPNLDLCLFPSHGRLKLVRYALGIALGLHKRNKDVIRLKAKKIYVKPKNSDFGSIQADGDVIGRAPCSFCIAENALELIVPTRY